MQMNWLRLWGEARNDRKLGTLSDAQFRVWFNLLCFANDQSPRGTFEIDDHELLSLEVAQGDDELLDSTLTRLAKLKMIVIEGTTGVFVNWDKRQNDKPSDKPEAVATRVAKFRQKQREGAAAQGRPASSEAAIAPETPEEADTQADVTPCNAPVTPCNAGVTPLKRPVTHRTEKNRTEQSREEQNREEQTTTEQSRGAGASALPPPLPSEAPHGEIAPVAAVSVAASSQSDFVLPVLPPAEPVPCPAPCPLPFPKETLCPDEIAEIARRLVAAGVNAADADRLAVSVPKVCLKQLDFLPFVKEFKSSRGAYLRTAIERDFSPPRGYKPPLERRREASPLPAAARRILPIAATASATGVTEASLAGVRTVRALIAERFQQDAARDVAAAGMARVT